MNEHPYVGLGLLLIYSLWDMYTKLLGSDSCLEYLCAKFINIKRQAGMYVCECVCASVCLSATDLRG